MKVNPYKIVVYTLVFFLFSAFNYPIPNQKTTEKFVVVLDAGHGGHDPGNLGNGFLEKDIALGIVLEAGKLLETNPDIKVVYTRKDDRFVDLYVRGEIANKAKADLFVSVHCDSHNSDAQGAGTFVLGLHANKQNFEIAKKENSVIYLEDNYETRYAAYDINSPESIIGLTIMQEEFLAQSILLGKMMQDNFTKNLRRKDRKVKQAGFIVLHQTFMPSILVETGFLTNKNEGTYLNSTKGQAEMGKAIADAIVQYKDNLRSSGGGFEEVGENVITPVPKEQEPEIQAEEAEVVEKQEPEPIVEKPAETKNEPAAEKKETADVATESEKAKITAVEKELKTTQVPAEDKTAEAAAIIAAAEKASKEQPAPVKDEAVVVKEPVKEKPATDTASVEKKEEETPAPKAVEKEKAVVTFKVQILASSKEIPLRSSNFRGLSQMSKEPYKNLYRYMYGSTNSYKQAQLLKANADQKGYTTSYIVAYKDGVRIPVKEAVKYSSE